MSEDTWPRYRSHRVIQATPIVRIDVPSLGALPLLFVDPSNGREAPVAFVPSEEGMARRCHIGDLAMLYPDGYRSVCPKRQFNEGYSPEWTP